MKPSGIEELKTLIYYTLSLAPEPGTAPFPPNTGEEEKNGLYNRVAFNKIIKNADFKLQFNWEIIF